MTLHADRLKQHDIVFGPVPSRRLGRSLGVDLTPHKTCSFDCIYCECGRTTNLTIERRLFFDPELILFEIESFFDKHGKQSVDAITFSGAGEPTLHKDLGFLIRRIKSKSHPIPVGVLTNGSLLWRSDVRNELMEADFVIPSLDAPNPTLFKRINRPHKDIQWELYIKGLKLFCSEYKGDLRLEVFLLKEKNSTKKDIDEFKELILDIDPPVVELNTLVRPGTEQTIAGLYPQEMREVVQALSPLPCKTIGKYEKKKIFENTTEDLDSSIIKMVSRRPCSLDEMSDSLGIPQDTLSKTINRLTQSNKIHKLGNFYFAGPDRKSAGIVSTTSQC